MFLTPVSDFFTILLYTMVATTMGVPLRKFCEFMIEKVFQKYPHHLHKKKHAAKAYSVVPGNASTSPSQTHLDSRENDELTMEEIQELNSAQRKKYDEFRQVQNLRSTLMRAARLDKAQKSMDFVLPAEESALIMLQQEADTQRLKNHMIFKNRVDNFSFRQMRYGFKNAKFEHVKTIVSAAREEADILKGELELMHTEEEREIYLMKHFFVNYFEGYKRKLVHRYMLGKFESVRNTYFRALRKYTFVFLLPALLAGMMYFIYIYQVSLGSRSTTLWAAITTVALFQEVMLLQPFKIWLRWILINAVIADEVRNVIFHFRDRCRIILMRTHGLMRDSNALVQHFNPACRTARMFPELPISRVLITVGDYDIPSKKKRGFMGTILFHITNLSMFLVMLPITLQDSLLEILVALTANGALLSLYDYATENLIGAVLIVAVSGGLLLSRESILILIEARKAAIARKKANENMFYEVAQETLMDLKVFEESEKDDEKMDGSVYLNELDMTSPNNIKRKPVSGSKYEASPSGNDAGGELDERWEGDVLQSPQAHPQQQATKPMWAASTIHNLQDAVDSQAFLGQMTSYETNRIMLPIKGPPIASSNKRIYGPEFQASKKNIDDEYMQKYPKGGALPPLKPTPTLMSIIQANATLFTGLETSRRSLPDSDDGDSTGPYAKPLGKRKSRKDSEKKLGRSRKRAQERERRLREQEGPGSGRRHSARDEMDERDETPLYYDSLKEQEEAAEAAAAAGGGEGEEKEQEPQGYGSDPRDGSRRKQERDRREKRRQREARGDRSGRSSSRDTGRSRRDSSRVKPLHRHSESDTSRSDREYDVREDLGAKARRKNKKQQEQRFRPEPDGPGSSSVDVFEGGTYSSVGLMQIQTNAALPEVDFLAGIVEGSDDDKSVFGNGAVYN